MRMADESKILLEQSHALVHVGPEWNRERRMSELTMWLHQVQMLLQTCSLRHINGENSAVIFPCN